MDLSNYWKYTFLTLTLLLNSLCWTENVAAQNIDSHAVELLGDVDSVLRSSNGIKFKAELMARMKGEDYHQIALFKIQRNPSKIYYRQFERNPIELLYDETVNSNEALINPAGFPYTNLYLSPYSFLILRRQHHSVFEADPVFILDQVFFMFEQCKPDKCTITLSDTIINGVELKKITYVNTHYNIKGVNVKETAHLLDFAKKHHVNFYSIVLLNKGLSVSSKVKQGDLIQVPSSYAKKIEIVIKPESFHIQSIVVYDGKGVFEQYKYLWFKNNVVFSPVEFSPANPDYNF